MEIEIVRRMRDSSQVDRQQKGSLFKTYQTTNIRKIPNQKEKFLWLIQRKKK
jgi:hypothetical protein